MRSRNVRTGFCALLLIAAGCAPTAPTTAPADDGRLSVLINSIHAHNAIGLGIEADPYSYHNAYGYRRAFSYLRSRNVQADEVSTGRLDAKLLSRYKVLFINLVSGDRPPFMLGEIAAIKAFVENGGGLMVITDHTNCYYHAHILAPLMEELGIKLHRELICERPPYTLGSGNGWVSFHKFAPHPVTAGLRWIAFQSGGTVDDKDAVVFSSEQSWGDLWQVKPYGQGDDGGFYGNWAQDPEERRGPLGVVLAKDFGKGRIVVVGDQNLFGDPFLNYGDNWRLWLNSMGWLLRDWPALDVNGYPQWHRPRVLCFEQPSSAAFGDSFEGGFYNAFCAIGRKLFTFASDDARGQWNLIVLAHDEYRLSADSREGLEAHLKAKRCIVYLSGDIDKMAGSDGVLSQLSRRLGPAKLHKGDDRSSATWECGGRIVILHDKQGFTNSVIPSCNTAPTTPQQLHTAELVRNLSVLMD